VKRPEDYPHSSYLFYISELDEQIVRTADVLGLFVGGPQKAQSRYKAFVESVLEKDLENPLKKVYGGAILGDEDFVNEVLANIEDGQLESKDISHRKAFSFSTHSDAVLVGICEHFGLSVEEALKKGSDFRKMYICLLKRHTDTSNQKLSKFLNLTNSSSVAKINERFVKELNGNDKLREQLNGLEVALSLVKTRPQG
jgi:putative transposase